jgi:hypothetical protein
MLKTLAAIPLLIAATFATPAQAQHHHHHGGGGWVAPFIGGAIVGGALGYAAPHYYGGYGYGGYSAYPNYYYPPAPPAYYSWCYDFYGRPYRC